MTVAHYPFFSFTSIATCNGWRKCFATQYWEHTHITHTRTGRKSSAQCTWNTPHTAHIHSSWNCGFLYNSIEQHYNIHSDFIPKYFITYRLYMLEMQCIWPLISQAHKQQLQESVRWTLCRIKNCCCMRWKTNLYYLDNFYDVVRWLGGVLALLYLPCDVATVIFGPPFSLSPSHSLTRWSVLHRLSLPLVLNYCKNIAHSFEWNSANMGFQDSGICTLVEICTAAQLMHMRVAFSVLLYAGTHTLSHMNTTQTNKKPPPQELWSHHFRFPLGFWCSCCCGCKCFVFFLLINYCDDNVLAYRTLQHLFEARELSFFSVSGTGTCFYIANDDVRFSYIECTARLHRER